MVAMLEGIGAVSGTTLTRGQQPVGQMDGIQNPDGMQIKLPIYRCHILHVHVHV